MVEHFTDMSGCIIAGDCPSWYKGEFISVQDVPGRKEYSIYRKLRLLSEPVLHLNDDFFALMDFDSSLPNFYFGTCADKQPTDKVYKDLYWNCPPHWKNFDIHCPIILDPDKFNTWDIDRPLKTYYANQNNLPGIEMTDCKIRGNGLDYNEILERIENRLFFSTTDNLKDHLLSVIQDLYPHKSDYEA